MNVQIAAGPFGTYEALFGIGLSYGLTSGYDTVRMSSEIKDRLKKVAEALAWKEGGGHNKFLETITLILDVDAPRYWWQEFDTYRVGITKQSESTIHTITKRPFDELDFMDGDIAGCILDELNKTRANYLKAEEKGEERMKEFYFRRLKCYLPEGFLQRRVVSVNAKCLKNIREQRANHKLKEWRIFLGSIYQGIMIQADENSDFLIRLIFRPEDVEFTKLI